MIIARLTKETDDITRLVIDMSKWLDGGEAVTSVTTPVVITDYCGYTGSSPLVVVAPVDATPLTVGTPAITGGATSVTLLVHAGTPGLAYFVEFDVTSASGRVRTLDAHVSISQPVGFRGAITLADIPISGTMRGPLILFRDPVLAMEAATKQYVDNHALTDATKLPLVGGTLTGALTGTALTLSGAATFNGPTTFNGLNTIANGHSFGFADLSGTNAKFQTISNALNFSSTDAAGASRLLWTVPLRDSTSPLAFTAPVLFNRGTTTWAGATNSPGIRLTQTVTGSTTASRPYAYDAVLTDTINRTAGFTGWNFDHNYGGGTTAGGRVGLSVNLIQQNGANADTGVDNFYVGLTATAFARVTQPGSSAANPIGRVFGANIIGEIQAGFAATNYYQVAGAEINYGMPNAGSSAAVRSGLTIADLSGLVQGSQSDNGLWLYGGGAGLRYGIAFGDCQIWPIDTANGTILGANIGSGFTRAFQAKWGVDIGQVAFPATGNPYDGGAFRSPGFAVDGAGTIQQGSAYTSWSSTGQTIDCKGSVGTGVAIASGGTGYISGTNTMAVTALGGVWLVSVTAGVVTAITTIVQPVFKTTTPPANPITPVSQNLSPAGLAGSGLTLNITWNTTANTLSLNPSGGPIKAPLLTNAANDTAASGAGVAVGQLYRNGSILMQRAA